MIDHSIVAEVKAPLLLRAVANDSGVGYRAQQRAHRRGSDGLRCAVTNLMYTRPGLTIDEADMQSMKAEY